MAKSLVHALERATRRAFPDKAEDREAAEPDRQGIGSPRKPLPIAGRRPKLDGNSMLGGTLQNRWRAGRRDGTRAECCGSATWPATGGPAVPCYLLLWRGGGAEAGGT